MKLVIVSGLSGSGKSIALETLEDCGYYCIDNLPVVLLDSFVREAMLANRDIFRKTALGLDARNESELLSQFQTSLAAMRQHGIDCEVIYLQAEPATLLKRFSETRRKHPLTSAMHPLSEAIELERRLLEPVASMADMLIDTTHTNVHQLRDLITRRVDQRLNHLMSLYFMSFGFKKGTPLDADFIFDARCLPNPHWEPLLRSKTGRDPEVVQFLRQSNEVVRYLDDISDFLDRWIPCFEAENRSYLTVAIGCTGGQHRSVYLVDALGKRFQKGTHDILVRHRELPA
ncbi:RNase adapter RapZ [Methylococcus sp. EFPC2]|uniref:RNase adapter RapZ n=1 Tax=Methylococcus sp. EFPC2 TaxID=2812648 RepID=UPI00196728FC|nr:RNase adapter RapZ [Methylococcus sp. EFPC2]QSA99010.1 RNase adapter RapZ [Methylococcus sp. EFPC2]